MKVIDAAAQMAPPLLFSPMPSSSHFSFKLPGGRRSSTPLRRRRLSGHNVYRVAGISAFLHAHQKLLLRANAQPADSGTKNEDPSNPEDPKEKASDAASPKQPGLPFPSVPIWARWILGSLVLVALPFYKKILRIEGKVEKTVETVMEVVEKVAEVTEKISVEVAEVLPDDSKGKKLLLEVKQIAELVVKDAELGEQLRMKVDEVVKKVDSTVEPMVEEITEGSTRRRGTDS